MADDAFLRQSYDVYAGVEEQFGQALAESLDPSGPGVLYDLVAGFGLPAGAAALDVGCGEGDDAIELTRRFGLTVRGIDPVLRHIDVAQAELARATEADPGLAGLVTFEQGKPGHCRPARRQRTCCGAATCWSTSRTWPARTANSGGCCGPAAGP